MCISSSRMEARIQNEVQAEMSDETCSSSNLSSIISSSVSEDHRLFSKLGLVRLNVDDEEHVRLKHRLYTSIGSLAQHCSVEAIYRNMHSSPSGRASLESFRLFLKATEQKRNGNANVVNGWHGTSKDGIRRILSNGFGMNGMPEDGVPQGFGLYLYSEHSAVESVLSSAVDVDGLRHILFCRVILGNSEEVPPGSRQFGPSSEKFDSGVDNMQSPTKYTIWYPHVNTHILPLYAMSVRVDFHTKGTQTESLRKPSSPWIPFSSLITVLSRILPPSQMCLVRRYHSDYMEKKISRKQLIFQIRQVSGDKVLISAIKSFQDKQTKSACPSPKYSKN
ncbi:hypothetical protein J5N97_008251 [Dioscorea zingiberensis]|uniref:Poly [ADP-ribose] polymerase n=1 Tax=Dioscorea zingiberensis TaxID=325984 RepID=A0A9D5HUE7_9LILI|nr:hypothetical protein J5N97_008251 [Dioscorea zingiberensis]